MHESVLLHETIDGLNLKGGSIVVDATLGGGGHSREICNRFGKSVAIIGIDLDSDALARSSKLLEEAGCNITVAEGSFRNAAEVVKGLGHEHVTALMIDLGVSSFQLGPSGRGFSFKYDEPLMMTLKKNPTPDDITAFDVVNTWKEKTLADIIYGFGEERYSRRIASAIVKARAQADIKTTFELVHIIGGAVPASYRHGKIHYATRTFQAIRIAVNQELQSLEEVIASLPAIMASGGRVAIISFHSLEDRIVKNQFRAFEEQGIARRINKRPIIASEEEVMHNPRSRSAKLRVIEFI